MNGLYALKPWYARRLAGPRAVLIRYGVRPSTVSWLGVLFACAAAGALAILPSGPVGAVVVAALLAARLACANLDGGLARSTGRSTPWGSVTNELSDRAADLVAIAALVAHVAPAAVAAAALGATLPSWVALAGAAAGAGRVQGGPVGKTERCLLLVLVAAIGHGDVIALAIAVGGLVTAALRLGRLRRDLAGAR
jgi:CDP-diacylglycerol--glycerol-3-phosphate 3-phosphatidyltransferase